MNTSKPQIIVVDDDNVFLGLFETCAAPLLLDFEIVCLGSMNDFQRHIATARAADIAVVIADAILQRDKGEYGADLLVYCRQKLPHALRILISGRALRENMEDAINRCALDAFFRKPFDLIMFVEHLKILLTQVEGTPVLVGDFAVETACDKLEHIVAGSREQANLYRDAVKDLLVFVFHPWLVAPRTEVGIRNATKAVDILFQNAATKGILADLKSRFDSLLVPVETKNSKTLHSSYFGQLESYLTLPVGKWGILCFRGEIQRKHLLQVMAAHNEGKLLMLFTDPELVELAKAKISGRQSRDDYKATLNQFLRKKYAESIG